MLDKTKNRVVLRRAFIDSLPVLMGYTSMGFAAGVILGVLGEAVVPFAPVWGFLSALIFSGTTSMSIPSLISIHRSFGTIALVMLAVNFRYAFYGFPLLNRWREVPLLNKAFLILGLTDETYALEIASPIKEKARFVRYCTYLAALNLSYWIVGIVAGTLFVVLLKGLCPIESIRYWTNGIGFSMVALFLVIFVDQVRGWFVHA